MKHVGCLKGLLELAETHMKKATRYRRSRSSRYVRRYEAPRTPAQRVLETGVLLPPERTALLYL